MKKFLIIIPFFMMIFTLSSCEAINDFGDYLNPSDASTCANECEETEKVVYEEVIVYEEKIVYETITETVTVSENFDKIIDTRDLIRTSNLYIEAEQYSLGFKDTPILETTSTGSGFVIHYEEGVYYALTNYHVLFSSDNIEESKVSIETLNGESTSASIIALDEARDIALIAFESNEILPIVDIFTRLEIPLLDGEFLLAVGNPNGILHVVTFGAYIDLRPIANVDYNVIYHTALIYSGNSGGALVDEDGFLLGMNTWSAFDSDTENYAIPLNIIHDFLSNNFDLYENMM
ncbi:MAG: S1C family serine protease [Candidatus Izemoplasmataceae bacterium]